MEKDNKPNRNIIRPEQEGCETQIYKGTEFNGMSFFQSRWKFSDF